MREHLTLEVYSKPTKPPLTTTTKFQVLERPPINRREDVLNQTSNLIVYVNGTLFIRSSTSMVSHCVKYIAGVYLHFLYIPTTRE